MYSGKLPSNFSPASNLQFSKVDEKAQQYLSQCSSSQLKNLSQNTSQQAAVNMVPSGYIYETPVYSESYIPRTLPIQSHASCQFASTYNSLPLHGDSRLNQMQANQSVLQHTNKPTKVDSVPSNFQNYVALRRPPYVSSTNSQMVNEHLMRIPPNSSMNSNRASMNFMPRSKLSHEHYLPLNQGNVAPETSKPMKQTPSLNNLCLSSIQHQADTSSAAPVMSVSAGHLPTSSLIIPGVQTSFPSRSSISSSALLTSRPLSNVLNTPISQNQACLTTVTAITPVSSGPALSTGPSTRNCFGLKTSNLDALIANRLLSNQQPVQKRQHEVKNDATRINQKKSKTDHSVEQSALPSVASGSSTTKKSASLIGLNSDGDSSENDTGDMTIRETRLNIAIDDDIEIVGTTVAAILFHIRSDCPVHPYRMIEDINLPPCNSNKSYCSKCYCYICDKLAKECDKWTDQMSPHCNANSKTSCWKARRNMKKSALINLLTGEELTPEIKAAGDLAMKNLIRIKEAYLTYRKGIPCEMHLVPCQCACHQSKDTKADLCAQCKAVHMLKKRFNYDAVFREVLKLIEEIRKEHDDQPYSALVLFEALIAELCAHRPADFNHITRTPSNPNPASQCRTPHILDEHFEWGLVEIFTRHDIDLTFKEKFLKCVKLSLQSLQLKNIMKRFWEMRHWENLLLRSVLIGQNSSGRMKGGDSLREVPLVIEMRVKKLNEEKRYQAVTRYLKAVKIAKAPKNCISDGTSIVRAMELWLLESLARRGEFREACKRLVSKFPVVRFFKVQDLLNLFSILTGQSMPSEIRSKDKFILKGFNKTMMLVTYMMCKDSHSSANSDFSFYLWLADWLNESKIEYKKNEINEWVQNSSTFLTLTKFLNPSKFLECIHQCHFLTSQVALFVCSALIAAYLTKNASNLQHIPELIDAYKNNEWVLCHMFSQPSLSKTSNHHMISWMANYLKSVGNSQNGSTAIALKLNLLQPEQVADFFHYFVNNTNKSMVELILNYYTEKHECPENTSARILIMKKVVEFLDSPVQENAMDKKDLMMLYAKLCSHDAVGWLICASCSLSMPDSWTSVWIALARNKMIGCLLETLNRTLDLFCTWIKEISWLDPGDMKRLLRCLEVFINNIVNTLVKHCKFDALDLKELIERSKDFVVYPDLQREYCDIIQRAFAALGDQKLTSSHLNQPANESISLPASAGHSNADVTEADKVQANRDPVVPQASGSSLDRMDGLSKSPSKQCHLLSKEKAGGINNEDQPHNNIVPCTRSDVASTTVLCSKCGKECQNCERSNPKAVSDALLSEKSISPKNGNEESTELELTKVKKYKRKKTVTRLQKLVDKLDADDDPKAISGSETSLATISSVTTSKKTIRNGGSVSANSTPNDTKTKSNDETMTSDAGDTLSSVTTSKKRNISSVSANSTPNDKMTQSNDETMTSDAGDIISSVPTSKKTIRSISSVSANSTPNDKMTQSNDETVTSDSHDFGRKKEDRNLFRSLKDLRDMSVPSDEEFHDDVLPPKRKKSARKTSILQKFRNITQDAVDSTATAAKKGCDKSNEVENQITSSTMDPKRTDPKPISTSESPIETSALPSVDPNCGIANSVKLPYNLQLTSYNCVVHLSTYPPELLEKIRHHQPELNLHNLYA